MEMTLSRHHLLKALAALFIATPLHAADAFPRACPAAGNAAFPGLEARIDALCGLGGTGITPAVTTENMIKNNFCAAGPPTTVTIKDMVALQHQIPSKSSRDPVSDRSVLRKLGEGRLVMLNGYVLVARQEGAESVNCGRDVPNGPEYHDIHIAIVDSPSNQDECTSVVVEMSPHHRPPSWNLALLRKVFVAHLPVRITGQLFFDSIHEPCTGDAPRGPNPRRASVWEIHPVYAFDVCTKATCDADGWLPLDKYATQ
jgi:hypothetical protein